MRTDEIHPADASREDTNRDETAAERLATVQRLSALQGYLALVLLAAGIGFETGPGWGIATLGLGLFVDAWRDTGAAQEARQGEES